MLKDIATGLEHIGIPTADVDGTVAFYRSLGFEQGFTRRDDAAREHVAFLSLGHLTLEVYRDESPTLRTGAIDHFAIAVTDIERAYKALQVAGARFSQDAGTVRRLPFHANGVRFFTIIGPNGERIEFSQVL